MVHTMRWRHTSDGQVVLDQPAVTDLLRLDAHLGLLADELHEELGIAERRLAHARERNSRSRNWMRPGVNRQEWMVACLSYGDLMSTYQDVLALRDMLRRHIRGLGVTGGLLVATTTGPLSTPADDYDHVFLTVGHRPARSPARPGVLVCTCGLLVFAGDFGDQGRSGGAER